MYQPYYKNPESVERVQDFALFLYKCAEEGDLSATQIRKLMFLSQMNQKSRDQKEKKGTQNKEMSL